MNDKKMNSANRIISCIGIGIGVLTIILGIITLCTRFTEPYHVISGYSYGTDYYTDTYKAMAAAANNAGLLYEILAPAVRAIGYVLLIAGMNVTLCFTLKLLKTFKTFKTKIVEVNDIDKNNLTNVENQ